MKPPIVDFSLFDVNKVIHGKEEIEKINPHRFELGLLDGILYTDWEGGRAVGFHDVPMDPFWARGHFPGKPMMPGVLICECAAQVCAWFATSTGVMGGSLIGLGGLNDVRFRAPVLPGDKLVVSLVREKFRQNFLINGLFQGFVNEEMVVEGMIKGVAIR